ncbi:MAG: efflux RND transporter periplasmic adaptor subunit [Pseudohongiella sp.]|nr:efflux RND transporter periplasmic adaptor subunit [Pseudohongiella sp.]MDP2125933.1 efflux RND transporter periplasmic adaptor subunit [Pseudohongiella sp.]
MKKQYLVAIGLFIFLVIWMFLPREESASVEDRYAIPETDRTVTAVAGNAAVDAGAGGFTVRTSRIQESTYTETVNVRGVTRAFRHVEILSEAAGRVVATPVARGARVNRGDVLCEIAVDNREVELQEARSREIQSRLEYEGSLGLRERNLVSEISVAQLKSTLDAATAAVGRAELALNRTKVRAPFSGILETRAVEVGDYLNMGAQCGSLLDDQPMLLIGQVPEQNVSKLILGNPVEGVLVTGERVSGRLTYIARAADPVSRSYRIEVELNAGQNPIRQGISTEIMVAASDIAAHMIPPSAITLDDRGVVGVKALDNNNVVAFYPVTIVGESTQLGTPGFWVTGLPQEVILITLGQELVFPGQTVRTNSDRSSL